MSQLYVLQLESGKYYIGKTDDVPNRYRQHKNGQGSEWTKIYKPTKMLETRDITSEHDENNVTKDYMKKYGIENVRGGSYCQTTLGATTFEFLKRETRGNSDACFKCGNYGHFARDCDESSSEEEEQVWVSNCCKKEFTNLTRAVTHERKCTEKQSKEPVCYRCGRKGHYSPDCYARSTVDGNDLSDDDDDDDDDEDNDDDFDEGSDFTSDEEYYN